MFLPESEPSEYYKTVFGLNDQEFKILSTMSNAQRHFLFKQGDDAVIVTLDLSKFEEMIEILSADEQITLIAVEVQAEYGQKPEEWLPNFFSVLEQLKQDFEAEEESAEIAPEPKN
jgi:type IV secretion system protein VirB4